MGTGVLSNAVSLVPRTIPMISLTHVGPFRRSDSSAERAIIGPEPTSNDRFLLMTIPLAVAVRCGSRQLGITALLPMEFREHARGAMTNSVCNSGRDSTRPPGRLRTYGQGQGSSHVTRRRAASSNLRRMRVRPSDCGAHEAARHEPPDRTAEDSHRRATEKIGFEGGAVRHARLRAGCRERLARSRCSAGLHDGLPP